MEKEEKPKTFEEVRQFLATIPAIHLGGCGISAYAMYKWLLKNEELSKVQKMKFMLCYDYLEKDVYENNLKNLYMKKIHEISGCCHVGLYYDYEFIDCEKNINRKRYDYIQFIESDDDWFLLAAINNKNTWNPTFNREHIAQIEEALEIDLQEIIW